MLPKHVSYQARPLPHGRLSDGIILALDKSLLSRLLEEPRELLDEPRNRLAPVRYPVHLGDVGLRVGLRVPLVDEYRVVPESAGPGLVESDGAPGHSLCHERFLPGRDEPDAAFEPGTPVFNPFPQAED